MGSNRAVKRDRLVRKKRKKNKKSKKSKSKGLEDNRMTNVVLNRPLAGKIPDLIRETLANITREKIVQLLFQVKEKADHCYDFDISFWLQKFLDLSDDVNLIETAYLIVNAGYIYERKVDLLYELVRRSTESSRNAAENGDKKDQALPKTRRRITRQAVSLHDRLYESEMHVKQFKQLPPERITELMSSSAHKVPSHYFKRWAEYKLWRQNHKKKMRNPVPYSTVCEDLYLHPAMWGLSCIEDFDYDDDLDTKRNYRMFTHHMEHRFNTIVPDVNFIMHFKVKDFIEAEQDEIEMMKILDLPTPPTREWPPFCRTSYSREYAKEAFNVDIGESAEDYVKKYVDLEDIVLEKPTYEIDSDLLRHATEARKNNMNVDSESGQSPQELIYEQLKKIMEARASTTSQVTSQEVETNLTDSPTSATAAVAEEGSEVDLQNSAENVDVAETICDVETNDDNHDYVDMVEVNPDTDDAIVPTTIDLETSPVEGGNRNLNSPCTSPVPQNVEVIERIAADLAKALKSNSHMNVVQDSAEDKRPSESMAESVAAGLQTSEAEASPSEHIMSATSADPIASTHIQNKNASCIISENIKSNISDQIVIRVSIDEGIAFSDLDDIDKAMLSPVVELVDIFNPFKQEKLSCEEINLIAERDGFRNMFGIDERYLQFQEDFNLPLNILYKQPKIVQNLFKLPESRLRRRINFALPQEFEIYMANRLKRKCCDKNDSGPMRMIKVFKLNEQNMKNIHETPPTTPNREEDFLGFEEMNISFNDFLSSTLDLTYLSKLLPSTTNRSISRDSGIGLSSSSDSQLITSSIAESDENFTVELSTDCEAVITPKEVANEDIDVKVPASYDSRTIEKIPSAPTKEIAEGCDEPMLEVDDFHENDEVPNQLCAIENSGASANETGKSSSVVVVQEEINGTKQSFIRESAEFEQNLYEKCANRVEKRASEMNLMTERIQRWHRYLRPILAVSMERHHFDIFGIGTDIINTFPDKNVTVPCENPVISLEDVMESRDSTFLSRYFLSMLQLINAGNVDIKVQQRDASQPTPINDIQLKLLSRKRHSVAIEDDIGARVLSSRKRNHSIGDDSDSTSESEELAIHVAQRSDKRACLANIAQSLNHQPHISPNTNFISHFEKNSSYRMADNRSLAASKTSTPCATKVVASTSNIKHSNLLKRSLSSYPSASSSPIPGPSTQSNIGDLVHSKTTPTTSVSMRTQDPSINQGSKQVDPSVSSLAVVHIYRGNLGKAQVFSNDLSNCSKKQEKLSSKNPPSKELPPFSSIRRFDVSKQGQESSQTTLQSPSVRDDSSESLTAAITLTPEAHTSATQNVVYNSSVVYPRLIRTQDAVFSAKHSRVGHDDLDSGIFRKSDPIHPLLKTV